MILEIILLLLSIPVGFLIAHLTRDELVQGRAWFQRLIILALVAAGWFALTGYTTIALTCTFIAIVALISYVRSFDRKWVRNG